MTSCRLEKKRVRTLLSECSLEESVGCSQWSDNFWQQINDLMDQAAGLSEAPAQTQKLVTWAESALSRTTAELPPHAPATTTPLNSASESEELVLSEASP